MLAIAAVMVERPTEFSPTAPTVVNVSDSIDDEIIRARYEDRS